MTTPRRRVVRSSHLLFDQPRLCPQNLNSPSVTKVIAGVLPAICWPYILDRVSPGFIQRKENTSVSSKIIDSSSGSMWISCLFSRTVNLFEYAVYIIFIFEATRKFRDALQRFHIL
jgi:hypothetical protein